MIYDPNTSNKLLKLKQKASTLKEISPLFYRQNNCVENCGGCCMKFSLVFWGPRWEKFKQFHFEESKRYKPELIEGVKVWVDYQEDNLDYFCKHLDKSNYRCNLHNTVKPLHCEMEPIAFSDGFLVKRPFKESHLMKIKEGKGALCYMGPVGSTVDKSEVSLLEELNTLIKEPNLEGIIVKLREKIL